MTGVTLADRLAAWRAGPGGGRFTALPEPSGAGLAERGRWLLAGSHLVNGRPVEAPGLAPWEVSSADPVLADAAHAFDWADDLAALGTREAGERAADWTGRWLRRFARGAGPGWTPALAARRLDRWLAHAALLTGGDAAGLAALASAAGRTLDFLGRRGSTAAGTDRVRVAGAMLRASLALGDQMGARDAAQALGREAAAQVDPHGAIASRNPEELADLFLILVVAEAALAAAGLPVDEAHRAAIARMAPVLRALRHADGALPRFHGGGHGLSERIDRALALSGVPPSLHESPAMGFARLAAGRTSVLVDAADPPDAAAAHASTLGIEMTSGRRPLIVSCGAGRGWGPDWHRAGRATASHSTLAIEGISSSRLGRDGERMVERARVLSAHRQRGPAGLHLHLLHAGWGASHGLTHRRDLLLAPDGRSLSGIDTLAALTPAEIRRLESVLRAAPDHRLGHALHFHLHPDVTAHPAPDGQSVTLALRNGETWLFRPEEETPLALEPSVCFDAAYRLPRPTRQIVLAGALVGPESRIGWTLAKTEDTPLAIRDTDRDDLPDRP